MAHKLIVSHIEDRYSLSPWWCQMVASSYEDFRGPAGVGRDRPGQLPIVLKDHNLDIEQDPRSSCRQRSSDYSPGIETRLSQAYGDFRPFCRA